ncbi:hypothetical protein HY095_01925 [Candidatus Micrarchaeota archaeon]|nr:hypothetical protein [Candidatus Micrarchaeota archaeon]
MNETRRVAESAASRVDAVILRKFRPIIKSVVDQSAFHRSKVLVPNDGSGIYIAIDHAPNISDSIITAAGITALNIRDHEPLEEACRLAGLAIHDIQTVYRTSVMNEARTVTMIHVKFKRLAGARRS